MRPNHPVLEGRRRRPLGGSFVNRKAADRQVADPFLLREEAFLTDIDFHLGRRRIDALEVCVNHRLISRSILFGIPSQQGLFGFKRAQIRFGILHSCQAGNFVQGLVV